MHSLLLNADLFDLSERWKARVDWEAFAALFLARKKDPSIKICRALEAPFLAGKGVPDAKTVAKAIREYHAAELKSLEKDLAAQKARLAAAREKLAKKRTKTAEQETARAEKQISRIERGLRRHAEDEPDPSRGRAFPFFFVPLLVMDNGEKTLVPSRFHCRPAGTPAHFDRKAYSMYKARRESLTREYFDRIRTHGEKPSLWEPLFGHRHGAILIRRFYESVPRHLHEGRPLKKGEKETSVVVGFEAGAEEGQLVPCLYDIWGKGEKTLHGFAMITDEAPPDVARAGYPRAPIALRPERLIDWLLPEGRSNEALHELLTERALTAYKAIA